MPITATAQGKTFTFPDGTTSEQMGVAIDEFFAQQTSMPIDPPRDPRKEITPLSEIDELPAIDGALAGGRSGKAKRLRDDGRAVGGNGISVSGAVESLRPEDPRLTRRLEDIPELGQGGLLFGEDKVRTAAIIPALMTATEPQELAQVLTSNFPNVGVTMTPPSSQNPQGRLIAVNNKTGATVELNKPGLSQLDVLQGLGITAAFLPAGGAGLAAGGVRGLGMLAGASGATQAGIEAVQAVSGGEFDQEEIATAAIAAPVGQVVASRVLSPLARAVGGRVTEPMKELIRKGKEKGVDILTSDVLPPQTFAGRTVQQLGEKLGVLGTGGKRAAQQKARIEVVEGLAQEMGLSIDTPVERDIFRSLKQGVARQLNKAGEIRNAAVQTLDKFGPLKHAKTINAIDEQIAKQLRLKKDADQQIIDRLTSLKESIDGANFGITKDLRSNLIDDVNAAFRGEALPTKAAAPLQAVKKAMDDDLLTFAKANDRQAASQWVRSNRIFADGYKKAKNTELSRLLKKGEGTPETVSTILKAGKPSELKRLNTVLNDQGRRSAQLSIIRDALTESGYFGAGANPDRFVTAMQKPARQKALNVFFKGADKKQIDGIAKVLAATRRAQEAPVSTATGQQLAAPVAAIAGAQFDAGVSFGTAGALAGIARAYESAGMRNLLLRLANAPKGSKAEQEVLKKVLPFFTAATQNAKELGAE